MQSRVGRLIVGIGIILGLAILPAQAQVSERQIGALVEALRQAAPQTGNAADGLYSDWQVQPDNISRWSKACLGKLISPADFAASPVTARNILVCVMRDVYQDEYRSSDNEAIAVRRAAAWWMTGDPSRYDSGDTATYTQRVLNLYQQQLGAAASSSPAPSSPASSSPAPSSTPSFGSTIATPPPDTATPSSSGEAATSSSQSQTTAYDRYMQAGYAATEKRDYDTALLYFKRALDERPDDTYAQRAIGNVERYRTP